MSPSLKCFTRISLLSFAIVSLFLLAACHSSAPDLSSPTPSPVSMNSVASASALSDWENEKRDGPQGMSVWGVGFDEAFPKIPTIGFHTVRVEPRTSLTIPFHFLNRSNERQLRRFFVLLDERQQLGGIGDDLSKPYVDAAIEAGAEITLAVRIPPLEPGPHDHIIISILNPDDPVGFDYSRGTLLAGNEAVSAARDFTPLADTHIGLSNLSVFITDNLGEPPIELREWLVAEATPAQLIQYAIYAGNVTTLNQDSGKMTADSDDNHFAILAFLDHRQIPIQENGPLVFYGGARENVTGRIMGSLRAPLEVGKHNLLVLRIDSPGVVLSDAVKSPQDPKPGTQLSWYIEAQDVTIQTIK